MSGEPGRTPQERRAALVVIAGGATAGVKEPSQQAAHDFARLPFVKSNGRGKGFDYWSVQTAGSYAADCQIGKEYADQFLALAPTNGACSLLGPIVLDMITKGPSCRGLIVGFMGRISLMAFASSSLRSN